VLLILVVRPLTASFALVVGRHWSRPRIGESTLGPRERAATAFFGVRGIGSIYYLAYATGHAEFEQVPLLWSTLGFAITVSVIVHGVTATPVMRWLDEHRDAAAS
jgi:NhaP-type Na+/H+ or K+/H+ antiporter